MSPNNSHTLEQVFEALALEHVIDKPTIANYLQRYPQFSAEVLNLARELQRPERAVEVPLEEADAKLLHGALHQFSVGLAGISDPLTSMTIEKQRSVAKLFDIPRQVITGLRERRVVASTVKERFVTKLAEALESTPDALRAALETRPQTQVARAYKADTQPTVQPQVSFEQLLVDAQVPPEKRRELLEEH